MADPPDTLHVDFYGSLRQPYDSLCCSKSGFCDEDLLQAGNVSEGFTTSPKWMPSSRNHASRNHFTHFDRQDTSQNDKRPSGHHPPGGPLSAAVGNDLKSRDLCRETHSDATAASLKHLTLEQSWENSARDRESPLARKRPASSEIQTSDAGLDQTRTHGKVPAAASKYIRTPAAEDTPFHNGSLVRQNKQNQHGQIASYNVTSTSPLMNAYLMEQTSQDQTCLRRRSCSKSNSDLKGRHPGPLLQPDSRPISHEQLAAEVKGIYAALVMVEAKCIKLDNAHMAGSGGIPNEQWQALIALHRTLLYEHHDFLSASQHPSANSSLRKLAAKYSMPARMWRHGIHSFLEVLRRRLPKSLDYMLQFIYMAYQMVALLFETIPSFTETWIECLGDLARYRMAIEEEDMRDREIWGGVARDWYSKASDKDPDVGRLYHHLGILARPNAVQQVYFYCRSLTCSQPFDNATDSLSSLLSPLLEVESGRPSMPYVDETDSMFLYLHAAILSSQSSKFNRASDSPPLLEASCYHKSRHAAQTENLCLVLILSEYRTQLETQIQRQALRWKDHGVFLAVANISACFGYGSSGNALSRAYRRSDHTSKASWFQNAQTDSTSEAQLKLLSDTFAVVLSQKHDFNVLPHVHTVLAFLWSVYKLEEMALMQRILKSIPWKKIVDFLNSFIKSEPVNQRILDAGRRGEFLQNPSNESRPLPEDYLLRGLVWCEEYFGPGWFNDKHDEESRLLELPSTNAVRIERVLWLGICLSEKRDFITFDHHTKGFLEMNL